MNSVCKSVYDPKNLHAIVLASGLTREKVSELTGVPVATLTSYMRENPSLPNLKHLTALADFFAVPLDFITGRCDKELADNIVNNYGRYFMELRRAPYEVYLDGRKQEKGTVYDAVEGETPWPYNLMGAIFGKDKERELMTEDQEAGIMEALGTLDIRHEGFILAYYRDGLSLKKIAECHKVSPEWARQVVAKGVRQLRHPAIAKYMLYGKNGVDGMKNNELARAELARQELELALYREKLCNKYSDLLSLKELISKFVDSSTSYIKAIEAKTEILSNLDNPHDAFNNFSVDEMNLPLRTSNCLKRANINTLGEVVRVAELGTLLEIDSLGKVSANEILSRVMELTGKDLFGANGLSKPQNPI